MSTYEGWTNYETWCVKLWLDNEEPLYRLWKEAAQQAESAYSLAQQLKDWLEEERPELEGMWCDLMQAALSEVNHDEIAESMLRDVKEEAEYQAAAQAKSSDAHP